MVQATAVCIGKLDLIGQRYGCEFLFQTVRRQRSWRPGCRYCCSPAQVLRISRATSRLCVICRNRVSFAVAGLDWCDVVDAEWRLRRTAAAYRLFVLDDVVAADGSDGRDTPVPRQVPNPLPDGAGQTDRCPIRVQHAGRRRRRLDRRLSWFGFSLAPVLFRLRTRSFGSVS